MRYMYSNELYHYGIRGQKWGIRRFQNPDGTLTKAGMRRYGTVENLQKGMTKKQAAEHEAEKQAAINSGKTAQVQKFSSELTREEMARAVQRIQDEQKLSELRAKDIDAGMQKVKSITNTIGQIASTAETVTKAYNAVADINNAFNSDKKLPKIGLKLAEQRHQEFDQLLRTKDIEYFRKNAGKFSSAELKEVEDRYGKAKAIDKKADKEKGITNKDRKESENQGNKDNKSQSQQKEKTDNSKSEEKKEKKVTDISDWDPSNYSQPSQKVAPKKVTDISDWDPSNYSQPSQKVAPKKEVEVPKYSQPSQTRITSDSGKSVLGKMFDSAYKGKHDIKVPTYSQPSQKSVEQVTKTLMSNNKTLASKLASNQEASKSAFNAYQMMHPGSEVSFNDFQDWFK